MVKDSVAVRLENVRREVLLAAGMCFGCDCDTANSLVYPQVRSKRPSFWSSRVSEIPTYCRSMGLRRSLTYLVLERICVSRSVTYV